MLGLSTHPGKAHCLANWGARKKSLSYHLGKRGQHGQPEQCRQPTREAQHSGTRRLRHMPLPRPCLKQQRFTEATRAMLRRVFRSMLLLLRRRQAGLVFCIVFVIVEIIVIEIIIVIVEVVIEVIFKIVFFVIFEVIFFVVFEVVDFIVGFFFEVFFIGFETSAPAEIVAQAGCPQVILVEFRPQREVYSPGHVAIHDAGG